MNTSNTEHFATVKGLAEHLGIARKTLYDRAKAHGIQLTGDYTPEQLRVLSERLETPKPHTDTRNSQPKAKKPNVVDILSKQLDEQQQQLEAKDAQIAELNERLAEAHKLTLVAQNKVLELETQPVKKHWWWFG